MFEELMITMQKEPIASALFLMVTLYYILKSTGLWDWLPDKIDKITDRITHKKT